MARSANVSHWRDVQRRAKTSDRPNDAALGQFITENGNVLVHVGRGTWAWFPHQATTLINIARAHGWGTKLVKVPTQQIVGTDSDGNPLVAPLVRLILLLGREEGTTHNGAPSKGYTYRLMWDTHETGTFRLVSKYRRTTTAPEWCEIGSMYEIRSIITRFSVIMADEAETEEKLADES